MDEDAKQPTEPVDPDNPPLTGKEVWRPGGERIRERIAAHKAKVAKRKEAATAPPTGKS
jgi:hypothetical protein